jgi:hypothetical protein
MPGVTGSPAMVAGVGHATKPFLQVSYFFSSWFSCSFRMHMGKETVFPAAPQMPPPLAIGNRHSLKKDIS